MVFFVLKSKIITKIFIHAVARHFPCSRVSLAINIMYMYSYVFRCNYDISELLSLNVKHLFQTAALSSSSEISWHGI